MSLKLTQLSNTYERFQKIHRLSQRRERGRILADGSTQTHPQLDHSLIAYAKS